MNITKNFGKHIGDFGGLIDGLTAAINNNSELVKSFDELESNLNSDKKEIESVINEVTEDIRAQLSEIKYSANTFIVNKENINKCITKIIQDLDMIN